MTFNWKEFFTLAQYLQKNCSDNSCSKEAILRTAVDRIYFAAYGLARDFAVKRHNFTPTKQADDHGKLIRHFKDRKATTIGANLEDLRNKRNMCAYESEVENLEDMFEDAIIVFQHLESKLK